MDNSRPEEYRHSELENEAARIVANANGESEVTARMLSPQILGMAPALPSDARGETLRQTMGRFEAWVLRCALDRHGNRRIATARSLGITRECLYKERRTPDGKFGPRGSRQLISGPNRAKR